LTTTNYPLSSPSPSQHLRAGPDPQDQRSSTTQSLFGGIDLSGLEPFVFCWPDSLPHPSIDSVFLERSSDTDHGSRIALSSPGIQLAQHHPLTKIVCFAANRQSTFTGQSTFTPTLLACDVLKAVVLFVSRFVIDKNESLRLINTAKPTRRPSNQDCRISAYA